LHEQFLGIIQEYRDKHGMPPVGGWPTLAESDSHARNVDRRPPASPVADHTANISEEQMPQSPEGETRAGASAAGMLDAFASVGARRFDVTWTDGGGRKVGFRGGLPLDRLRSAIPAILHEAADRQHNVIVRPRGGGPALIQLDDLDAATAG